MNGVAKAGHIRDKLTRLITYAETVRALTDMAALRAPVDDRGIAYPDPLTTNLAKYTFATQYHPRWSWCRTAPGGCWSPVRAAPTGPIPRCGRCWRSSTPPRRRPRSGSACSTLISDLTARDFGGYHAVLAVHAEGSIEAEKMQIYRAYEPAEPRLRATARGID